jgi:polyisoprenoid-binding protein YceI
MNRIFKTGAFAATLAVLAPMLAFSAVTSKDPAHVTAGQYNVDPTHASVLARIDHIGFSTTTVTFDKISGGFDYDPAKPEQATLSVSLDASALDSGFDARDNELRGAGFFNVAAFPEITFKSTRLVPVDATHAKVEGQLTLLGVTKPVTLDVTFNGFGTGMMGDTRVGFLAAATVQRSDFGMKTFLPAIGDKVDLVIDAEFIKRK